MMRFPVPCLAALAAVAVGAAHAQNGDADADAAAGEDYLDRTPESCILLPLVRSTEVIDDRTLLFYMRGGDVFINVLDNPCFGLDSAGSFISETRTSRLCRADMIQAFRQFGGNSFPGNFCRLGDFYPITEAEAELMEMTPDELEAARRSVVLTPIDPDDAAAEPDGSEDGETPASAPEDGRSEQAGP